MAKEKIEVKIEGPKTELSIREGAALPLREPIKVKEEGNIKAPGNFIKVREGKKEFAVVTFSRSKMQIFYQENAFNYFGAEITGKLLVNPELLAFGINAGKVISTDELAKFLKMNRAFFANQDECNKLVQALITCKVKVQTLIDKDADARGNKKLHYDKVVESEIPHFFKLKMPVFVGYDPAEFNVEICFDTSDASIKVWLDSVELNEIIKRDRDIIINEQLKIFEEQGLIIIEE